MTHEQALEYFGSYTNMAYALGCAVSTLSEKDPFSDGRQYQMQIATNGKLKADKPALRNPNWRKRKSQ